MTEEHKRKITAHDPAEQEIADIVLKVHKHTFSELARRYYELGKLDAAREIGLAASSAGLAPKDLAKEADWKEAVEKIKNSEREALKKLIRKIGEESEWPITDLLNEL